MHGSAANPRPIAARHSAALTGTVTVPGDKSISHRAFLFGGIAAGTTRVTGLLAGEDVIASTAPCQAMASALETEGLPVTLSEDAGDYLCNFTLYRLLHTKAAPKVGFLHVPQARECAEAATFELAQIRQAVSAAAAAFCADLTRPAA